MQALKLASLLKSCHVQGMPKIAAVFTGDLIGSVRAGNANVDKAMAVLQQASAALANIVEGEETRFDRHRGDGWQMYLSRPHLIFTASLLLTARLRAADIGLATRISIGLGTIDRLGDAGLSAASGHAFTLSGRGLDSMLRSSKRIALTGAGATEKWQAAIFHLTDWQASKWSREQAEIVALTLEMKDPTQAKLAEKLGISRQAVQSRLQASGYPAMEWAHYAFQSHDFWSSSGA